MSSSPAYSEDRQPIATGSDAIKRELILAIFKGDADKLRQMIRRGADVNSEISINHEGNKFIFSGLSLTSLLGDVEEAQLLLDAGAKIGETCNFQWLILGQAAVNSINELAEGRSASLKNVIHSQVVIKCHLQRSQYRIGRQTPGADLLKAIIEGKLDLVKRLVSSGADPNAREDSLRGLRWPGRSALMISMLEGRVEIARYLLQKGANVNARSGIASRWGTWDGFTPLMLSVELKIPSLIDELLAAGADLKAADQDEMTALHHAVVNNNVEVAKTLIARGSDKEAKTRGGATPLILAARHLNIQVVEALIHLRVQLDAQDNYGESALLTVTRHREHAGQFPSERAARRRAAAAIFDVLLRAGASARTKDLQGRTALMEAATYGSLAQFKRLLSVKIPADPLAKTNDGRTVLADAAFGGSVEMCRLLIAAGVDVNDADDQGRTPLMTSTNKEITRFLVAKGANVNAINVKGRTALSFAAEAGDTDIISVLLRLGADPNKWIDNDSAPPIEFAINSKITNNVELLLKTGADPNIRHVDGRTPFMQAIRNSDNTEIIQLLLMHGGNPKLKDKKGKDSFEFAAQLKHKEIVLELLKKYRR